jgi:hypothetical protein
MQLIEAELFHSAKYNTTLHPLNKNMKGNGNAAIMGISQVYIG